MTSMFRTAILSAGLFLFACSKPDVSGTLLIEGGVAATRSSDVHLALQVTASSGATLEEMCFSNDDSVWSAWEPFAPAAIWRLAAGDGAKTVYARVRDSNEREGKLSAQIILDTTPPVLTSVLLNGGAQYTGSATVSLSVSAEADTGSPLTLLCIAAAGPPQCQPFATTTTVTLTGGDGAKTATVSVKDEAGNESQGMAASITLDTTPPIISSVSIDSAATYARSATVQVSVDATDATSGVSEVAFSEDGTTFGAFAPHVPAGNELTLALPDGEKTVWVKVRDGAGNESASPSASDSIILDTIPPGGTILLADGALWSGSPTVSVIVFADEATSGIARMCPKEDTAPPAASDACWIPYASSASFSFPAGDGWRELNVWFEDQAGWISLLPSNDGISIDTTPPAVPADVTVVPRHRKGTFTWTASSDATSGVARYEVGIAATAGGPYTWTSTGLGLSGVVTGLQNMRQWYGVVRAIDETGNASAPSAEVAFTPQFPFTETQRRPTSDALEAVVMFSPAAGIVVGEAGTAFATGNAWMTWSRIDALSDETLYGSAQLGDNGAVVVGAGGHIAWSGDRGTTWTAAVSPAGTTDLLAATGSSLFMPYTALVIVGEAGTILTAPSLGAPLTARESGVTTALRGVARNGVGDVLAVGDSGVVLRSTDDGATWTPLAVPPEYASASFRDVAVAPAGTLFYLSGSFPPSVPALLMYNRLANSFTSVNGLTDFSAEALVATSYYVFLAGDGGRAYRYDGATFVQSNMAASGSIRALAAVKAVATSFAAAGDHGQINYNQDGDPTSWVNRTIGPAISQFDAWIGSGGLAWASGEGISYSTSGGAPWGLQWYLSPSFIMRGLAAQSRTADPFAVGSGGVILQYQSGTESWSDVGNNTAEDLYDIGCVETECYAVGAAELVVHYNGSIWWEDSSLPGGITLRSIALYMDGATLRGIVVGDMGNVRTLSGTTWSWVSPIPGAADLLGVARSGTTGVALAVASDGKVWKTVDHGTTWTQAATLAPGLRAIAWGPSGAWYAAGAGTPIYKSADDGTTWTVLVPGSTRVVNGLVATSAAFGPPGPDWVFALGDYGSILRSVTGGE